MIYVIFLFELSALALSQLHEGLVALKLKLNHMKTGVKTHKLCRRQNPCMQSFKVYNAFTFLWHLILQFKKTLHIFLLIVPLCRWRRLPHSLISHSLSLSLSFSVYVSLSHPPPASLLKQSSITCIPLCYPSLNLPPSSWPIQWSGSSWLAAGHSTLSASVTLLLVAEGRLTAPWANQ